MSFDRLIAAIRRTGNPSVVGLDPKLEYIPDHIVKEAFREHGETLEGAAAALYAFNCGLIDAVCDVVPAVKPQAAYYELYGWPGMRALAQTIAYASQKGLYVITDGKRNDIGTTMEAYASAHLGTTSVGGRELTAFGGDALTVNGYLGEDGIRPLLSVCRKMDKGIFVLVKTSNPSSGDLQDKLIDDRTDPRVDGHAEPRPVYRHMGDLCELWGQQLSGQHGYSGVGAVVGATWPHQLTTLRRALPHTMFLVPGYGAQGGGASDVAGAFDSNGLGAIVNSSRAILCAWQKEHTAPEDYAAAARREALRMKEDITAVIR